MIKETLTPFASASDEHQKCFEMAQDRYFSHVLLSMAMVGLLAINRLAIAFIPRVYSLALTKNHFEIYEQLGVQRLGAVVLILLWKGFNTFR